MRHLGLATTVALSLLAAACGIETRVPRVYDGQVVDGLFVPAEAYAAYLRGVLAEEAGDDRTALAAYEETVKEDDEDPEPYTRIGAARCRLDPKDKAADKAFKQAQEIDARYEPLLAARARCAAARGQADQAVALTEQVGRADRQSPALEAIYLSLTKRPDRARAVALTVAAGEHVVAWEALTAWGKAHGDPELVARGFEGLLRVAPMRSAEVESGALELLGQGQEQLARRVAVAVADAPADLGVRNVHDATVARLAIDEALAHGDLASAERRAVRGHVARAEIAGRALLLERADLAAPLVHAILAADPTDPGAAMVEVALAGAVDGVGSRPAANAPPPGSLQPGVVGLGSRLAPVPPAGVKAPPPAAPNAAAPVAFVGAFVGAAPAACAFALARRLEARGEGDAARVFLAHVALERMAPHDPLAGAALVDLAARGVAPDAALSTELRLELAARRGEPAPATEATILDAKHMLLFHSLVDPAGAPARSLLAKLAPAADRDPLVGFALVRAAIAAAPAAPDAWARVRAAIAAAPTDPLVLAAAVELAKKSGKAEDVAPARARLMAVARTPAERALARQSP